MRQLETKDYRVPACHFLNSVFTSGVSDRGDHSTFEFELRAIDVHGTGIQEFCLAEIDVDAKITEPLCGVIRADSCSQSSHPLHRCAKIHLH
jgi:hypothetical protein